MTKTPSLDIARATVAAWVAAGCRHAVLCPGSRSAPFAYALAEAEKAGQLTLHVRLDERGAGFFALGLARAEILKGDPRPVLVVTTSGTAVANLHPAVLEASHSGVPLVVVSADRPHELRGTGANQTTDQVGMFARAVRDEREFPAGFRIEAVTGHVRRLAAAALGTFTSHPGPVHLNVALDVPLAPENLAMAWEERSASASEQSRQIIPAELPQVALEQGPRTVVIAGDGAGSEIVDIAHAANWPLFAEPSSGARVAGSITNYRDLLTTALADEIERVIVVGHPTLSRPVSALLARRDTEIVVVGNPWTDVAGAATRIIGRLGQPEGAPSESDEAFAARWTRADDELSRRAGEAGLVTDAEIVARAVWASSTPKALVLGSSNAIRAADAVAVGGIAGTAGSAAGGEPSGTATGATQPAHVVANRGLAGIDGTLATALGLSHCLAEEGEPTPVRALVGDLTFLHDLNSLLLGSNESDAKLHAVVLNDAGGAIFKTLEYGAKGELEEHFERLFATPQQADLAALCAGLGVSHHRIEAGSEHFERDLQAALAAPISGRSVTEVIISRENLREIGSRRRELAAEIVAAL